MKGKVGGLIIILLDIKKREEVGWMNEKR